MSAARKTFLAVDLGASGGRVMAGHFDGSRLEIEEGARFANSGLQSTDGWHWDAEGLFKEITQGLAAAGARFGGDIVSVAVDTWGVDYALIGPEGTALNEPWMYRDSRTDGMISEAARLALIRRAVASVAAAAAPGAGAAAAWQGKGSRSCPSGALVRRVLKL
jgi:rhamnulokinase